jgi:hypothetical protein
MGLPSFARRRLISDDTRYLPVITDMNLWRFNLLVSDLCHNHAVEPDRDFKTFADLMAKVGALLFYWSGLEQELTSAIMDSRFRLELPLSAARGGLSERLAVWIELGSQLNENQGHLDIANEVRAQCLELRDIRNVIVHGLFAGDARSDSSAPHIICVTGGYEEPDSSSHSYTIEDLEHITQAIDACRRSFICLDYFNYKLTSRAFGSVRVVSRVYPF